LKLSTVFPIAEQYNTHSDFLLRKYSDDVTRAFLNRLFNLGVRWDIFRIKRFLEQNPILSSFERILSEIKLPYEIGEEDPSFFLKLDKTYDLYLNKRTGKFRNYLKRIERKIGEAGQYYFCQVEINGNIHDAYTQLLLIEKNSWKHIHGTAISSIRRQKEFYQKLCTGFHKTGLLHLEFMYLNDNPIAYNLGVIKDNIYFYLKTSFDERYRKHSPSTLLRAHLIKKLIKGYLRDIYWNILGKTIKNPDWSNAPKSIEFICKGNICRSPFAQYIVEKTAGSRINDEIKIDSAGLEAKERDRSPGNAILAASDYGINLENHKPKSIDRKMFEGSAMVIVMETCQFQALKKRFPESMDKIFLLPLFENNKNAEMRGFYRYNIQDPYGKSLNEFHVCFRRIERCLEGLFDEIEKR
jgi:protein-tyrosine phosphatase